MSSVRFAIDLSEQVARIQSIDTTSEPDKTRASIVIIEKYCQIKKLL